MPTIGLLLGHLPHARTTRLLASLIHRAAPTGTTVVELDATTLPAHPPYLDAPMPVAVAQWKHAIAGLDGLIVITPSHERSIPGALKHALDWASCSPNVLDGLPTVIAGAARAGEHRFSAITHLRGVLLDEHSDVMGQPELTLDVDPDAFGPAGECEDAALWEDASALVARAAGFARHLGRARIAAVPTDPIAAIAAAPPGPMSPPGGIATHAAAAATEVLPSAPIAPAAPLELDARASSGIVDVSP